MRMTHISDKELVSLSRKELNRELCNLSEEEAAILRQRWSMMEDYAMSYHKTHASQKEEFESERNILTSEVDELTRENI